MMLDLSARLRSAPIDPAAVAHACQAVSAHTTADELLEVAARAVLELTGAAACAITTTEPDGAAWLTLHVARQGDELVRLTDDLPAPPSGPRALELTLQIDGASRGTLALAELADPALAAGPLAPLITQIGLGLKHAVLYAELEALVVREMQTSVEREQAMQLVLDSMHDGLLVCELDGRASPIRSRALTDVFGDPGDRTIWQYLAAETPDLALHFEIGWDQTVSDVLPFELAVSQMPTQLQRGERSYRLAYQRVERDGALAQIAVSVSDITDELAAQLAHELAHELAAVVRSMMADRDGFCTFLDETDQLLLDLGGAADEQARWIHTLKGNTAMFGFKWFAGRCHELEDELAGGVDLGAEHLERLRRSWQQSLEQIRPFLGTRNTEDITVARDELAEQISRMRDAGVALELLTELERWRMEPVGPSLERLARQAERIADLLGKQVAISIEGARIRFADDRMRRLLAPLVHAVRNAVDHGLERPDERVAAGKSPTGSLVLSCTQSATELVLEVRDDGRGVSWDRVRAKAEAVGLPSATRGDLIEVLFADGVSTADEVSEISGRGVGLGALRETCRSLGGAVAVESEPGLGTRLTCRVPLVR